MVDIEKLKNIAENLRENKWWFSGNIIREAIAEIESFRAIVAKLPKTADGKPVVPGVDKVYMPLIGFSHVPFDVSAGGIVTATTKVSDCYSTPEAAKAVVKP